METIEPQTLIEWLVYTVLWIGTAIAVAGLYVFVRKKEYKIQHPQTQDAQRNALKLIMRDRLGDLLDEYKKQGYVSDVQFADATEHYDTYKSLYGNSFGDSIYAEIRDIHKKQIKE